MPARTSEISIDYAGRTYRANYRTAGQTMVVGGRYGQADALIGADGAPEQLAQLMLLGLAQAWLRRESRLGALSA